MLKLCAILVVCLWGKASSQENTGYANFDFDCRRTGSTCLNDGKCQADDGHCDCSDGTGDGYDCHIPSGIPDFNPATCAQCDSEGTLKCDAATCYCKEASFGTTCADRRVYHDCKGEGVMEISFTPHGLFTGKVYELSDPVNCDYSTSVQSGTMPLTFTFTDAACPAEVITSKDFLDRDTYNNTYEFMMEFDPNFKTEHDAIIKIMCVETEGGTVTLSAMVNIDPTDFSNLVKIESIASMPAGLSLVLTNDPTNPANPLDDPTVLGTELTLKFTQIVADYAFFEVNDLKADDCDPTSGFEIKLVEAGCLTLFAKSIITDFKNDIEGTDTDTGNPTKELHIVFDAFKFSGTSDQVCFTAEAAICKNDVVPCTGELCDQVVLILPTGPLDRQLTVGSNARRRKRRESFSFTSEEFAGGSLTVGYNAKEVEASAAQLKDVTRLVYDKTRCMQGMAFIMPLVVMAIMLVLSMATTFSFCVKSGGTAKSKWDLDELKGKSSDMFDPNQNIIKS